MIALLHLARRWPGLSEADREDLAQDAVAALLDHMRNDPVRVINVDAYFRGIVTIKAKRFLAQRRDLDIHRYLEMRQNPDLARDPAVSAEAADMLRLISKTVRNLESVDRRIVELKFHRDLTLAEIGYRVGLDKSGVHRRLTKILQRLRRVAGSESQ